MTSERDGRVGWYHRYLQRCNDHQFGELGEFVSDDVQVNGTRQGRDRYAAGLRAVVDAFPDYRWDLRHLLVDGPWLSARLTGNGTHAGTFLGVPATGRVVSTQELAIYRVDQGKIVESWGDLGSTVRDELTWGAPG